MTFPLRIGTSRPRALATLSAGLLTWHSNGSQRLPAHILKGVHSDICCDPQALQRREPLEISTPFPCSHRTNDDRRRRYDGINRKAQV